MDVPEANVPNPGETPRQSEVCYRERRSIRRCPTTVQQGPLKPALAQAIWRQRFISHGAGATTSPMPLRTSFAAPTGCSALATPPSLTPPSLVGGQDVRTSIHHLTLRTPRPPEHTQTVALDVKYFLLDTVLSRSPSPLSARPTGTPERDRSPRHTTRPQADAPSRLAHNTSLDHGLSLTPHSIILDNSCARLTAYPPAPL